MLDLVDTFKLKHPHTKLLISMPPPTRNNLNIKIQNVNTLLKVKLKDKVDIVENYESFLGPRGPKYHLYDDDVHLSDEGLRLLVSNIKRKCGRVCA